MTPRGGPRPGAGRPRTREGDYVTTSVELPRELWERLGEEARRERASKSEIVRTAILLYLDGE